MCIALFVEEVLIHHLHQGLINLSLVQTHRIEFVAYLFVAPITVIAIRADLDDRLFERYAFPSLHVELFRSYGLDLEPQKKAAHKGSLFSNYAMVHCLQQYLFSFFIQEFVVEERQCIL